MLLVVLLAVLASGPGSDEIARRNQQKSSATSATQPADVADANPNGVPRPPVAAATPSENQPPVPQSPQEEMTPPGQDEPSSPEPSSFPPPMDAGAEPEATDGDLRPDDSPDTQIPTIPPLPPDAEEQLKSSVGEARSPQDFRAVTEKALRYVDQAIAAGDAETAKKLVSWAVATARDAGRDELSKSATLRYLELQGPLTASAMEDARKRLGTWCRDNNLQCALAGFSAAWRIAPEVRYSVAAVYVKSSGFDREMLDGLGAYQGGKRVDTGANLLLWRPFDPSALVGNRTTSETDAPVTSAIQTFLDLKRMAGRGAEAAAAVYERQLVGELRHAAERIKELRHDDV